MPIWSTKCHSIIQKQNSIHHIDPTSAFESKIGILPIWSNIVISNPILSIAFQVVNVSTISYTRPDLLCPLVNRWSCVQGFDLLESPRSSPWENLTWGCCHLSLLPTYMFTHELDTILKILNYSPSALHKLCYGPGPHPPPNTETLYIPHRRWPYIAVWVKKRVRRGTENKWTCNGKN